MDRIIWLKIGTSEVFLWSPDLYPHGFYLYGTMKEKE
jgi:hypothetical protein